MTGTALKQSIRARLNLVDLCETGYWFCAACQHVTDVDLDGPYNKCKICGSPRVKCHGPIFPKTPTLNENQKILSANPV